LIELDVSDNNLTKIDVGQCDRLTQLLLADNPLTEVKFCDAWSYEELSLSHFDMASLDLSQAMQLKELTVAYPKPIDRNTSVLKALKLPETDTLISLNLNENYSLTSVDLSPYPNLEKFYFTGCKNCEPIDFTKTPKLKEIQLSDVPNWPGHIQVDQCPDLEELWIQNSRSLGRVDVTQNPKLKKLSFYDSNVYYLDVSQNPELIRIDLTGTTLFCFDLSNNPNIDFATSKFGVHEYPIRLDLDSTCDLGALSMGPIFDLARVSNLKGATLEGKILKVDPSAPAGQNPDGHVITYDYDCGQGHTQSFTMRVIEREVPPPTEPTTLPPTGEAMTYVIYAIPVLMLAMVGILWGLAKRRYD
jgi:hypothetical protein